MTVASRLLDFWDAVPSYIKIVTGASVLVASITLAGLRTKAKSKPQRPRVQYPRDTVILHNPGRGPYAPSLVPFAIKVETYLRILKIPHQTVTDYQKGPKGKYPWIEYNDKIVADSAFIIKFINKTFNVDLDKGFNEEELAATHALRKMMEENTYWADKFTAWTRHARFGYKTLVSDPQSKECNMTNICENYILNIPKDVARWLGYDATGPRTFVMNRWYFDENKTMQNILHMSSKDIAFRRNKIKKHTYMFGIGRHTEEEVNEIMAEDLNALSKFLGNKKFLLGDTVCQADCAIFGQLCQFYWHCPKTPAETAVKSFPNLCTYCERMKELYWPDWKECNTNGGTKEATA